MIYDLPAALGAWLAADYPVLGSSESSAGGPSVDGPPPPNCPPAVPNSPPNKNSLEFFPDVAPTLVQYFAFLGCYVLELYLRTIISSTASIRWF